MVDRIDKKNPETSAQSEAEIDLDCLAWEALLADKMDGAMAPEAEAAFAEHGRRCPGCSELLEQAGQGREWLKLLEEHAPATPVHLLSKILAKTQGAGHESDYPLGTGIAHGAALLPGQAGRWGLPFLPPPSAAVRGANHARLLMTAGMAFFSVALTLSVVGVRLNSVHAAELRPQAVQADVSRSFYGTKKQVVSFYENLRLVYEVESKMHELRHDSDQTAPAPGKQPAPEASPKPGSSGQRHAATRHEQNAAGRPVVYGQPVSVAYVQPGQSRFEAALKPSNVFSNQIGATSEERNRI
jgi:hypothetical protein